MPTNLDHDQITFNPQIDLNATWQKFCDIVDTKYTTATTTEKWQPAYLQYATRADLDKFATDLASRIYKIISEHTRIDITEEEFMSLLKEDE